MSDHSQVQCIREKSGILSDESFNRTHLLHNDDRYTNIVWFEPTYSARKDFQQISNKFNRACHKVDVFKEIDKCTDALTKIPSDCKAYLLMPGTWASDLLNQSELLSVWGTSVEQIFIYSSSPQQYEYLRQQNPCIQNIYANIEDVWNVIRHCVDKRCEVLRFYKQRTIRGLSLEDINVEFIWFLAFQEALLHIPRDEEAKNDMLDVCRRFYKKDNIQLGLIDEFQTTYRLEDAPRWFSRSSFLYKLINRALRTQDVEQLYVFRYFIGDLSSWLSREFKKSAEHKEKLILYRGASLSQEDYQSLHRKKLLAPNGFFSTSRNIEVAKRFIGSGRSNTVRVLYIIDCDLSCYSDEEITELVAFVDISKISCIRDEEEVLFDLGATFQINNIEPPSVKNDYAIIHLVPSCQGSRMLHQYRESCRDEIKRSSAALIFGILLFKTGNYLAALHYFEQLLKDRKNANIKNIHYYLGWTHMRLGAYEEAIINFEQEHDLVEQWDDISRARILNSIGKALIKKDLIQDSIIYYKTGLDLLIKCLGPKHDDVVRSYANVVRLYQRTGNEPLAQMYYQKSEETKIRSTNAITVLCEIEETSSDLHDTKQSPDIDRHEVSKDTKVCHKFHSPDNVPILVTPQSKEIKYRLRCLENAIKRSPESEIEITEALEKLAYAYAAEGRFRIALDHYLSALQRREDQEQSSTNSLEIARTINHIGNMYRHLYRLEKALVFYKRAITIYDMFPDETKENRLRTLDKIYKVTQEISKINITATVSFSKDADVSMSLQPIENTKINLQRSQTIPN